MIYDASKTDAEVLKQAKDKLNRIDADVCRVPDRLKC